MTRVSAPIVSCFNIFYETVQRIGSLFHSLSLVHFLVFQRTSIWRSVRPSIRVVLLAFSTRVDRCSYRDVSYHLLAIFDPCCFVLYAHVNCAPFDLRVIIYSKYMLFKMILSKTNVNDIHVPQPALPDTFLVSLLSMK